jgi:GNAT superfamily N-acetyltransferase
MDRHHGSGAALRIRLAILEDVPALQDVYRRSSWSNEGDRALLIEHPEFLEFSDAAVRESRTWVAVICDQVVGFVTLLATASAAEIEDLFVDPVFMRRGIGRALIETMVSVAANRGWGQIEVDANPHAQRFYEQAGFVTVGRVQLEHGVAVRMLRATAVAQDTRP